MERVRVFDKGVTLVEPEPSTYGEYQFLMREGDVISPRVEVSEPLKNQCNHFLECVVQGKRPLSSGWEGQDVVRVMKAIDRSIERRGAPVEVV
jgi:predicted dehydrogenase